MSNENARPFLGEPLDPDTMVRVGDHDVLVTVTTRPATVEEIEENAQPGHEGHPHEAADLRIFTTMIPENLPYLFNHMAVAQLMSYTDATYGGMDEAPEDENNPAARSLHMSLMDTLASFVVDAREHITEIHPDAKVGDIYACPGGVALFMLRMMPPQMQRDLLGHAISQLAMSGWQPAPYTDAGTEPGV